MLVFAWEAFGASVHVAVVGKKPGDIDAALSDTVITHNISVDFRINSSEIDSAYSSNSASLRELRGVIGEAASDTLKTLLSVEISGYASPDGPLAKNKALSVSRAETLRRYLSENCGVPDTLMHFGDTSVPWALLREIVSASGEPWSDEALRIMAIGSDDNAADNARRMGSLKRLRDGEAWGMLKSEMLPRLRSSYALTTIFIERRQQASPVEPDTLPQTEIPSYPPPFQFEAESACNQRVRAEKRPFFMALYTNMLADALLMPNIGAEFYLGRKFSVGADYTHAWWSLDRRHRYWRIYGGGLHARYWIGHRADSKPLTGHHIGLYAQCYTFDFELGGKAYMGGKPGGTIFDRAHFGAGVEYGFSMPVSRRLNIDFSVGVGYIGGRVYEFVPDGDRYLWTATKNRRWIGPAKLEVSLVWLIGRGNENKRKEAQP